MKVGIVCPYDLGRPGGVQDQCRRLLGWLEEAGHEAVLVGPGVEGPAGAVLLGGTTIVKANRSGAPILLDPRAGVPLRRALHGVDVLHVHEPFMPAIGPLALRIEWAPAVATFHADPPGWVRGVYRVGRPLARRALGRATVVTAVSPVAGAALDGIVDYRVIPNGIDVVDYTTGPKEPLRVTFLGRDDPRKGLEVLLGAWPAIRSVHPTASLHVIGAERTDPPAGVTFLGPVSEEVKRAELGASVVHAAPNLGGESFGIVVLEAMAAGCAVVASDLEGFRYVGDDAVEFVTPGDASALAGAVADLLSRPDRAAPLADAARQRSYRFDGPEIAAEYVGAYEEAVTEAR